MPKKASLKKKVVKKSSSKSNKKNSFKTKSKKVKKNENSQTKNPKIKGKQIGEVSNYFENIGVAAIKLGAELKIGDRIRIIGGEVDFEQKVESMQIRHETVQKAKKGDEIGIKIKEKVRKGYRVFKA